LGVSIPSEPERVATYLAILGQELGRGGFAFVPKEKILAVQRRVYAQPPDVYDRYTGVRDEARYATARPALLAALHEELGCDAILHARVVVVNSVWTLGTAVWDGATEDVEGGSMDSGWIAALSVWLTLDDMHDKEIYFGTGGIQVLVGFEQKGLFSQPE